MDAQQHLENATHDETADAPYEEVRKPGMVKRVVGILMVIVGAFVFLGFLVSLLQGNGLPEDADGGYLFGWLLAAFVTLGAAALLFVVGIRLQLTKRRWVDPQG